MASFRYIRSLKAVSILSASLVAASIFGAAPASAAGSWSVEAPTQATQVSTLVKKDFGGYTLQLRYGRYGGKGWIWARITDIDSDMSGDNLWIKVHNRASDAEVSKWTSINGKKTTFSVAYRYRADHTFQACEKNNILGGSPAVCITHRI
ncbi:hypothetical protein [Nonomuraea sp. NPDC050643]|uniref:hypothetical protein n=1 Tax=Nonomuraea sp. NPDC050643 TaxID=3155660 RepID=UPI0033F1F85D